MKKVFYLLTLSLITFSFSANAQFGGLKNVGKDIGSKLPGGKKPALSEEEVGAGLKEALNRGIETGVERVSKPDGYFKDMSIKVLMPDDAKKVEEKLRSMGQGKKVDEAIESMNRAAEDAANGAKDIFVGAIKAMTIKDAMNILRGEDNAATTYLEKTTRPKLKEKFLPVIEKSLEKVGATKHWNSVFTTYNKIPMVKKVNPDLADHVTEKALDGLFKQIAKEELKIRKDPAARVTDLLKKVFG